MRSGVGSGLAAIVVATVSASCDSAEVDRCGDDAALHLVGGYAYCVYEPGRAPDRDACPDDLPQRVVVRGVTACTDDPDPTPERVDALCEEQGVECMMFPPGPAGWSTLASTRISNACPTREDVHGVVGCEAVVSGWSGGVADALNDRLILWGGGGGDNYYGNEVYGIDVRASTVERLTEPSQPETECLDALPDGNPQSRATYDGLSFVAHAGVMLAWSGQIAGPACGSDPDALWSFDVDARTWSAIDARTDRPLSREGISASDYDPETRLVFLHDTHALFSFDVAANTFTELLDSDVATRSYAFVGRVHVAERRFVIVGGGVAVAFDLGVGAGYAPTELTLDGCETLIATNYPGLAYDPIDETLVGWAGGGTVYVIDPVADTCEPRAITGDVPGDPQTNGTHGRFRYFPSIDAFVLVNAYDEDASMLRLRDP